MTDYVDRHLDPGETVIYRARLHWIVYVTPMLLLGMGIVFVLPGRLPGGSYAGLAILGAGLIVLLSAWIRQTSSEFAVTTKRIIIKVGMLSRQDVDNAAATVDGDEAQVQSAVALCRSHGIQTGMFLMWGYEGEELDDVEATVQHVKRTNPDIFFTTVAYPIKGTAYFAEVAERVEALKPWNVSSDREFRVRGRHSRRFYSFADRLLRSEVELERMHAKPEVDLPAIHRLQSEAADARAGLHASISEQEA